MKQGKAEEQETEESKGLSASHLETKEGR